jgi:hypothetical protein
VRKTLGAFVATTAVLGVGAVAVAGNGGDIKETLTGYEETPLALSTSGVGDFRAHLNRSAEEIEYTLSFGGLESAVTQAHIHFEKRAESGPIVVWLCETETNQNPLPDNSTPTCPAEGGSVTGVIGPADVQGGAAPRGLEAGNFAEFVRALRAGATYANVHSTGRPGGEIRAQLEDSSRGDD